jgi:PAS domain S-box-containing protein
MSRKTKIVLAITLMITAIVCTFCYAYISQILRERLIAAYRAAVLPATQIAYLAPDAVPDLSSTRVDTDNPLAMYKAVALYLRADPGLSAMMTSVVSNSPFVFDVAIVDSDGRAILHSQPEMNDKPVPARAAFPGLRDMRFRDQMRALYGPGRVYEVVQPLQLQGRSFGSVRIGISTVFLRNNFTPTLMRVIYFSVVAIVLSLILASAISHLALGPLKIISRSLDSVSAGQVEVLAEGRSLADEYGLVTLKIAHLGRRMRDSNQIFTALKENVEQVMSKLQDGLMLFTRDNHVVLLSASAERFLGKPRREILGRSARDIFSESDPVGAVILHGFEERRPIPLVEVENERGKRIQVTLDFIREKGTLIGALLTLRDVESARRLESEIEMSRRLSASGRLTRGVGHEVKNPINSIVLHLQLLQNKLKQVDPDTRKHVDIIDKEIRRLDRVVQILVDFTRPRDLTLEDADLRRLIEDVITLAGPEAENRGVRIIGELPPEKLCIKVDCDVMKQAILNIVLNGIQAMPQGGELRVAAHREDSVVTAEISDQGMGIPPEVRDKIFELYFTTKKGGSGIGLAQAYQTLQWHNGSLDFESEPGHGTTFRLRLPLADSTLAEVEEPEKSEMKATG